MNRDELRAKLLARAPSVRTVRIEDVDYYVREMTGAERDRFDQVTTELRNAGKPPTDGFRARILSLSLCDDKGGLLFTADELEQLSALPASHTEPLVEAALEVNGLTEAIVKELETNL